MKREPLEAVLALLAALMIFFAGLLIFCEHFFPNDGQVFQVISGLLTGISGAFLMRITPRKPGDPIPDNSSVQSTTTTPATPEKE